MFTIGTFYVHERDQRGALTYTRGSDRLTCTSEALEMLTCTRESYDKSILVHVPVHESPKTFSLLMS